MRFSYWIYRWLLKLYPAGFRERYTDPMQRQFREDLAEVRSTPELLRFWGQTLWDFARSMPGQLARELGQDTRHALRLWRRRPINTAFAIAVLTIAIGANTGVFSVLNALLLRSLPFDEPDRLAALHMFGAPRNEFHAWRHESAYLADASMYDSFEVNLEGSQRAGRMRLTETSWNFFALVGRSPIAGRSFAEGEDTPGRTAVAVISYGLWQGLFAGDPRALGSTVRINGAPLTVVGVAPPGFDYPEKTDIWSPSTFDYDRIPKTGAVLFWFTIGRLKPGLTWAQARLAFENEAYKRAPERRTETPTNRPALLRLQDQLAGPVRRASAILMGGVALLLLLACTNVANLLLARTAARSSELMIRTALGASRTRLTQQLLTESVLLSVVAAIAGLLVAHWTTAVVSAVQPAQLASQAYTILDWRVLIFAMTMSVITGLIFGIGPALYSARGNFTGFGRSVGATDHRSRMRNTLMAVQVALTITLVTGSFALGRAFISLLRIDNGYAIETLVTMNVSLVGTAHAVPGQARAYYESVLRSLSDVAEVHSASFTESLPLAVESYMAGHYTLDHAGPTTFATLSGVGPGYFATMGSRLLSGREFSDRDLDDRDPVVIVNEPFARAFGDPSTVIGKRITAERFPASRIIGVVAAMRDSGPAVQPHAQVFFLRGSPTGATIVARTNGRARDRLAIVRDAVQSVDPRVPVFNVKSMEDRLEAALARPKFYATAVTFFGGLALLLAIVGVYGVVSYTVLQRTREMGIRLALGTTPANLRATLLRKTLVTVGLGALAGTALSNGLGRYLRSLLAGAETELVATASLAVAITAIAAAAAIWSATRHIARLDVCDVLRAESAD
jgi:putative ABC transport system permease protein